MATMYTLRACEEIIDKYIDADGEVCTIEEGVLGLGLVVCFGEGLKTCIITEKYINEWTSGHTIRFYAKMPKKYANMIDNL